MEIPSYYPRGGYTDQEQVCPKYIKWGLCVDCDLRCRAGRCPFIQHEWELKQRVTPPFFTDRIICLNCRTELSIHHFLIHLNNMRGYKEINVKTDKIHHSVFIDNCTFCRPVDGWFVGTPNQEMLYDCEIQEDADRARTVNRILNKTQSLAQDDPERKERVYRSNWVVYSDFNAVGTSGVGKSQRLLELDGQLPIPEPRPDIKTDSIDEFDPLAETIPIEMNPCSVHKQRAGTHNCEFCYKDFCRHCIISFADKYICPNCIEKKEVKQLLHRLGYITDDYDHKYTDSHYTPDSYGNPLMVKRNGDYALPIRKVVATIIDMLLHRFFFVGFALFAWVILSNTLSFGHINRFLSIIDNVFQMPLEELIMWPFDNPAYIPISVFTLVSESLLVLIALLKYRQTFGMYIMGIIYSNDVGNHNTFSVLFVTSILHVVNILTFGLISITSLWDRQYRSIQEYILGTRTLTQWQSILTDNPLETVYLTGKREPSLFKIKPKQAAPAHQIDYSASKHQTSLLIPDTYDSDNPVTPRAN